MHKYILLSVLLNFLVPNLSASHARHKPDQFFVDFTYKISRLVEIANQDPIKQKRRTWIAVCELKRSLDDKDYKITDPTSKDILQEYDLLAPTGDQVLREIRRHYLPTEPLPTYGVIIPEIGERLKLQRYIIDHLK